MLKISAFIHAKGNSKRLPNKNTKLIDGKPLFSYALENALESKLINEVFIDSDSELILEQGKSLGAKRLKRPNYLANNSASGDDLMYWQASNSKDADIVLQVVPTSPFISSKSIDNAISLLIDSQMNSVVGVSSEVFYRWENGKPIYYQNGRIPNSNEMEPIIFETTGLYINKRQFVLKEKKRMDPNSCKPYFLSKIEAIDINNEEDFNLAEIIVLGKKKLNLKI